MSSRRVVLRDTRDAKGTRRLDATLMANGDLTIEGLDYGDGVEEIFGMREYEWVWTIRAANLPALGRALETGGDVLAAIERRFSGEQAADLIGFLEAHEIPHESWSRMGD